MCVLCVCALIIREFGDSMIRVIKMICMSMGVLCLCLVSLCHARAQLYAPLCNWIECAIKNENEKI